MEHRSADADGAQRDSGLDSLAIIGRFHGIPVDPNQLRHDFAKTRQLFAPSDLVLAARRLGLKAREVTSDWQTRTALPALVQQNDQSFLVAAKIVEDRILLHDTATNAPVAIDPSSAGQPVTIKVESFPFTRYGVIDGQVSSVSRNSIADEKFGPVLRRTRARGPLDDERRWCGRAAFTGHGCHGRGDDGDEKTDRIRAEPGDAARG